MSAREPFGLGLLDAFVKPEVKCHPHDNVEHDNYVDVQYPAQPEVKEGEKCG